MNDRTHRGGGEKPRAQARRVRKSSVPSPSESEIPEVTGKREAAIRERLARRKPRDVLAAIERPVCPACDQGTLQPATDLVADWVRDGERTVLANLTGYRCDRCGKHVYDSVSSTLISRFVDRSRPEGGYTATVSSLGGGKLGIYLPRDVLRNVTFERNDEIRITPLSRKRLVIEKVEA